jgi:hypothetical protein
LSIKEGADNIRIKEILVSSLTANMDEDVLKANSNSPSDIIDEQLDRYSKQNTKTLIKSLGNPTKALLFELHKYSILKAKYNDELDPEVRKKVSNGQVKIKRKKKIDEVNFLEEIRDLCVKIVDQSNYGSKKDFKEKLESKLDLNSLGFWGFVVFTLLLFPFMVGVAYGVAWLEVSKDHTIASLAEMSWPLWIGVFLLSSMIMVGVIKGMNNEREEPDSNEWSDVIGHECIYCIEPVLTRAEFMFEKTSYKHQNKDGSPDLRNKTNPPIKQETSIFLCESCKNKMNVKLFSIGSRLQKMEVRDVNHHS